MISSSDLKFRNELAAEITRIIEMSDEDRHTRYGNEGWRLIIRRYLEATAKEVV